MSDLIICDAQNLGAVARRMFNKRIDYRCIYDTAVDWIQESGNPPSDLEALIFVAGASSSLAFLRVLSTIGWDARDYKYISETDKFDWDVTIAVLTMEWLYTQASDSSRFVLASCDGDFTALLRHVRQRGCRVATMGIAGRSPNSYKAVSDAQIVMDNTFLR